MRKKNEMPDRVEKRTLEEKFRARATMIVERMFGKNEHPFGIIQMDWEHFHLFSAVHYIQSGVIDERLVDKMKNGGRLLVVGTGRADLETLLWKGFKIPPDQMVMADIKVHPNTDKLPFERLQFDMREDWPPFKTKFDFIIFPESFGVAHRYELGPTNARRLHEFQWNVADKILEGKRLRKTDTVFFKTLVESDNPATVKKYGVILTAMRNLAEGGELRLAGHFLNEQEIAYILLKLKEEFPKLQFKTCPNRPREETLIIERNSSKRAKWGPTTSP